MLGMLGFLAGQPAPASPPTDAAADGATVAASAGFASLLASLTRAPEAPVTAADPATGGSIGDEVPQAPAEESAPASGPSPELVSATVEQVPTVALAAESPTVVETASVTAVTASPARVDAAHRSTVGPVVLTAVGGTVVTSQPVGGTVLPQTTTSTRFSGRTAGEPGALPLPMATSATAAVPVAVDSEPLPTPVPALPAGAPGDLISPLAADAAAPAAAQVTTATAAGSTSPTLAPAQAPSTGPPAAAPPDVADSPAPLPDAPVATESATAAGGAETAPAAAPTAAAANTVVAPPPLETDQPAAETQLHLRRDAGGSPTRIGATPATDSTPTPVARQVSGGLSRALADGGVETVKIRLQPAELGQVDVRLTARGDQLQVILVASTAEAERALRENLTELIDGLGQRAARFHSLDIRVEQRETTEDRSQPRDDQRREAPSRGSGNDRGGQRRPAREPRTTAEAWADLARGGI